MIPSEPILAIETSTAHGSVALFEAGQVLAAHEFTCGFSYGEDLVSSIRGLLEKADVAISRVAAVGVSVGPGSYTGVRVGVTSAKTLGLALGCPVVGVETLRAVAAARLLAARRAGERGELWSLSVLDGRQDFLFAAAFRSAADPQWPPTGLQLAAPAIPQSVDRAAELCPALVSKLGVLGVRQLGIVGEGAEKFLTLVESHVDREAMGKVTFTPCSTAPLDRSLAVALLALDALQQPGDEATPWRSRVARSREEIHRLVPIYMRPTEAEHKLMESDSACS